MRYSAPTEELLAEHLQTYQVDVIGSSQGNLLEQWFENIEFLLMPTIQIGIVISCTA